MVRTAGLDVPPPSSLRDERLKRHVVDADYNARVVAAYFGRGGTFLDLGANIGEVSIRCAGQFDRVVAVEAHPDTATFMSRRVVEADLSSKIEVVNAAVAQRTGETYYVSNPSLFSMSSTAKRDKRFRNKPEAYYRPVQTISLDDLVTRYRPRAVKIDIEKSEYECLPGFTFPDCVDRLVIEFHQLLEQQVRDEIIRIVAGIEAGGLRLNDRGDFLRRVKSGDWKWGTISFVFTRGKRT